MKFQQMKEDSVTEENPKPEDKQEQPDPPQVDMSDWVVGTQANGFYSYNPMGVQN